MNTQQEEPVCCLVGAGVFGDEDWTPRERDLVIAADGGFRACRDRGLRVDAAVGDFDSLGEVPEDVPVRILPVVKDETDMRAALEEGWKRGYRNFRLYGGTGGRLSHTLANIALLSELSERGGRGVLVGEQVRIRVLAGGESLTFDETRSGSLSVFCLGDRAEGVREKGLKYELEDAVLTRQFPLGVSNEFVGQRASVSVRKGCLLLIWEKDV